MKEAKFIREVDGLAEYEILERIEGQGKKYKAEKVPIIINNRKKIKNHNIFKERLKKENRFNNKGVL